MAATLRLNPKQTEAFQAQALKIPPVLGALNRFFDQISQRIHHIPVNPLPVEGIASPAVNDFPLGIHDIVVFQQTFAHPKIVFFDFLLGPLDGFGDHRMLNHFAFFVPKAIHDVRNPLGTKEPHQIILQRNKENGRTRIPLTTCTTPQLPVHPARFVTLRADNRQTTRFLHPGAEFDIRTTTGHVGGNGHIARATRLRYNFGFALVLLGIQNIVLEFAQCHHTAQQFRGFNRSRSHQNRPARFHQTSYLIDDGGVLLSFGLVNQILFVFANNRTMGRNDHHIQLINLPQFAGLCFGRTGHTGQFVVHPKEILQGHRCKSLRSRFNFHIFFGFNRLMQTIGIATPVQYTPCLFIHNFDLVLINNVFNIPFKEAIRLEQLIDGMNPLRFNLKILHQNRFLLGFVGGLQVGLFNFRNHGTYIR